MGNLRGIYFDRAYSGFLFDLRKDVKYVPLIEGSTQPDIIANCGTQRVSTYICTTQGKGELIM